MNRAQAYRYRLNVRDVATATFLSQQVGCARFVWNKALALSESRYLGNKALSALLPTWKREHPWLAEADSIGLQQSLRHFNQAWQNFFREPGRVGRPKFKKRFANDSYRFVGAAAAKTRSNAIWLPKLGWVTFRASRAWQGEVKSVTITRKAGKWYVSLRCDVEVEAPAIRNEPWLGIDVGIAQYATLSDGQHYLGANSFRKNRRYLTRLQRAFARRKKGSARRRKMAGRIAAMHARIANIRLDRAHKVSSEIVKKHGRIRMEDLRLINMMASAKGTAEDPGKNVAQKRGLNRHLADLGLRQLRTFVAYKLNWSGGLFEAVNPQYTSQKCHACSHIDKANRPSQAVFKCVACGHFDHADINAAKNIRDTAAGNSRSESTRRRRRWPADETCKLGFTSRILAL
jgi:putative transposase